MQATSQAQFESTKSGGLPPLELVRENLWAVPIPIPGGYMSYSLLYILRDDAFGVHLIDPGWDDDENWQRLITALTQIGARIEDVRSVTVTHIHPDHSGMSDRVRAASGAVVGILESEVKSIDVQGISADTQERNFVGWGVPEARRDELRRMLVGLPGRSLPTADRTLDDGERLDIPGVDLIVMATPGHTPGSLCLLDDARELMFTGDHLLPMMHPGIGLGGPTASNPLADYLASLARISNYPDYEVLPGHGYRFSGLAERAAQSSAHHLRRTREVREVMAVDPEAAVWTIAQQLTWTSGWDKLAGFYLYSALAQTAMHQDYVRSLPAG